MAARGHVIAVCAGVALGVAALTASAADAGAEAKPSPRFGAAARLFARSASGAVSTNWAGYAVADANPSTPSTSFTSVTGTWKQPRAACRAGKTTYSATWVGLGGFANTSQALEQTGTSADCSASGKASYSVWYELVPAPSIPVKLKIAPGDTIAASVNVTGSSVLVQIKDRTRHTSFTKRLTATSLDLTSAEWIEEAPSACTSSGQCRVLPLANFGSVTIGKIATIGSGHPGTASDSAWEATGLQLIPDANDSFQSTAGASPTALSPDGRQFGVVWQQAPTAPSGG